MPPSAEVRGWARLAAGVADHVVLRTVEDTHRAISDSAYRWTGPVGRPVQQVTDAVADRVYNAIRLSLGVAGEVGAAVAEHLGTGRTQPSLATDKARAIAHGVVGDELMSLAPELDMEMTLRRDGREIAPDARSIAATYPDARHRVVVFVHGLVDTEAVWNERTDIGTPTLPEIVAAADATPVLVRYGTGRHIGRNGADLAELLESVCDSWPVPLSQLTIVGHSMGGLVARSACLAADERGHRWPDVLDNVLYVATPHLGSWLEKFANVLSWVLRRDARSAPLGALLDGRSPGIKALRFGSLIHDETSEADADDLLAGLTPDEPWLEDVTHHVIVGRLREGRHLLNVTFGDALVRSGSATGVGRRRRIGDGGDVIVTEVSASHSRLARHPQIAGLLGDVLH